MMIIMADDYSFLKYVFIFSQGVCFTDFYVKSNGRVSQSDDLLQSGVVYRVEPRLCGGKGGNQTFVNIRIW